MPSAPIRVSTPVSPVGHLLARDITFIALIKCHADSPVPSKVGIPVKST